MDVPQSEIDAINKESGYRVMCTSCGYKTNDSNINSGDVCSCNKGIMRTHYEHFLRNIGGFIAHWPAKKEPSKFKPLVTPTDFVGKKKEEPTECVCAPVHVELRHSDMTSSTVVLLEKSSTDCGFCRRKNL